MQANQELVAAWVKKGLTTPWVFSGQALPRYVQTTTNRVQAILLAWLVWVVFVEWWKVNNSWRKIWVKKEAEEIKDNMAHTAQSARLVTDKSIHGFQKRALTLGSLKDCSPTLLSLEDKICFQRFFPFFFKICWLAASLISLPSFSAD